MSSSVDDRRLQLPADVVESPISLELVSVWSLNNKVKILSRDQTPLDSRADIWAEIVAGIICNIADTTSVALGITKHQAASMIADAVTKNIQASAEEQ